MFLSFNNLINQCFDFITDKMISVTITEFNDPQRYRQSVDLLKKIKNHSSVLSAYKKMKLNRTELLLSLDDWLDLFTLYENSIDEMRFKLNPDTLVVKDYSKINIFLTNRINRLGVGSRVTFFNSYGFYHLMRSLREMGIMQIDNKREIVSVYGPCEEVVSINYLITLIKRVQHSLDSNAGWGFLLKKFNDFLVDLAKDELKITVGRLTNNLTKKQSSSSQNNNQPLTELVKSIASQNTSLQGRAGEVLNVLCPMLYELSESEQKLSPQDKVLLQNTIKEDLPKLISHYIALPEELRVNLIDKTTNLSVKEIFEQGLEKVLVDIKTLHTATFDLCSKDNAQSENSIKEIKTISHYLRTRSSR